MLPAPFEYHAPETTDETLALLDQLGDEGKVLAGGQSLIPMLKLRFASPGHLIDINRVQGLDFLDDRDATLRIGPLFRHKAAERSSLLASRYPVMAEAARQVSDPIVRNLGTIGGSLAHADPAGDWGSVMLAVGGRVVARSSGGERTIDVDDLFHSTFMTSLEPNELITEVQVPTPRARSGGTYLKLERKIGDFATVGVAVQLSMDDGHIADTGIGLTSVGPRNIKARDAEAALKGA